MTAAAVQIRPETKPPAPAPEAGPARARVGRAAAVLQLAIAACYAGGVLVPALAAGALPVVPAGDENVRLWASGSATADAGHILGFFAATVGMAVTVACVPVLLTTLVRSWRRQSTRARAVLITAAVLGIAFLAFSATPAGRALRGCIAD